MKMKKKQFEEAQKADPQYMMFIADVKNSKIILKNRNGRREFQFLLNDVREMLNETPGVVQFEDSGTKFNLIRKGDCVGFVVDTSAENTDLYNITNKWNDILKRNRLRFHQNACSLSSLDNYMEFFSYLEKDSKIPTIMPNEQEIKNKSLKITIDLDVEDFIEEDYIRDEISYVLDNYGWKANVFSIKPKDK
jgi:hypothetical protein